MRLQSRFRILASNRCRNHATTRLIVAARALL
jgi:hypothetical protein